MSFDPLKLCTKDTTRKDRTWFIVKPEILYPAMIERFTEIIEGDNPDELFKGKLDAVDAAKRLLSKVQKFNKTDLDEALLPRQECINIHVVERRTEVLETARLWFTRALKISVNKPIGINITKNDNWRL